MASVVKPLNLTVNSTNVAASAYLTYASGTTYSKDNFVSAVSAEDGLVHEYKSVADANTGNALTDSTWWVDLGPCNRDAMFDARTSTVTTGAGAITVNVAPNAYFDTIAVLNVRDATSVVISVDRDGVNLFSDTTSLTEDVASWFDYFFSDIGDQTTKYIWNPEIFYADANISLTVNGSSPILGLLMVGRAKELGLTEYGASVSIEDYSTKETDQWGRTYLLERGYADRASVKMVLPSGQVDSVRKALADLRATPALYDMNNSDDILYDSLVIFGKYDDFSVDIAYHSFSYCSLSLTGLI